MAPHSSTLAWKIPWMEEPGRLQSMGSQRVTQTEQLHFHFSCIGEGNGNPLQCSCLENPRDRGAWWAAVYGLHRVGHDWHNLAAAAASSYRSLLTLKISLKCLLSDNIIPVSEDFATFFILMKLFSGWLLCCLMRLGLHKGHSKLRIYKAFFNFGHAGAWSGLLGCQGSFY